MEPGVYLYKKNLFSLVDTPEGAHFKSLNGDYFYSRVALEYIFKGRKCLDMKLEDFFADINQVKKVKIVAGYVKEIQT